MKIKTLFLKKIFNISTKINENLYLYFETNKLVCQSMIDGNASLVEFIHTMECKKLNNPVVIPLKKIRTLLSILADDDLINIDLSTEGYATFKAKNITRKIRLIEPEKPRFTMPDERKEEPLQFTFDADIFTSFLKNPINASSDIEGYINLIFEKDKILITKKDMTDEFNSDIKGDNIKVNKYNSRIVNIYNQEILLYFLGNVDGKINIKSLAQGPIKLTSNPIKDLIIKYMQAPLVDAE